MSARAILILSLGLNLVLGAWVLAKPRRAPATHAAQPVSEVPAAKSLPVWRVQRTNVIEVTTNRVDAPGFHWSQIETNDYDAFVAHELPARASPAYPPTVRLANVVLSGTDEAATAGLATAAGEWFARALAPLAAGALEVIGPAPCAVDRIKDRWRWHLVLRARKASLLTKVTRRFLTTFEIPGRHSLRVTFDRDPVSLL